MRLALAAIAAVALTGALPSAANADVVDVNCTTPAGTGQCSSGWYTTNVTVNFTINGGTNPSPGCSGGTLSTDTTGQQFVCTVTVNGTQIVGQTVTIKRDATAPTVASVTAGRGPDSNGWYNQPVQVTATGNDATSGIASCTSATYSGPDSSSASVAATCVDNAGNRSAPQTLTFPYDATPPSVSPTSARPADANGWFNHPVAVAFSGSDSLSGLDSCTSATYSGPDSGSATVTGSCRDKAGNSASATFALKYDATPPTVTDAQPDRQPDSGTSFNHRVAITFAGTDATSGIASCDTVSYAGPNSANAKVTGVCRDQAANVSAPASFSFRFDATPPKLSNLVVAGIHKGASLSWKVSADAVRITIVRTSRGGKPKTLYDGKRIARFTAGRLRDGTRYVFRVTAVDGAGNAVTLTRAVTAGSSLLAPRPGARVHGPTVLRWRPVARASYYNVQLWYRGHKVLTTWPTTASLATPPGLRPGRYTWMVWPGIGVRSADHYGPMIGRGTFVVVP